MGVTSCAVKIAIDYTLSAYILPIQQFAAIPNKPLID